MSIQSITLVDGRYIQIGENKWQVVVEGLNEGQKIDEETEKRIAAIALKILQSSKIDFIDLSNTKITKEGIESDQISEKKIEASKIKKFDKRFAKIGAKVNEIILKPMEASKDLSEVKAEVKKEDPAVQKPALKCLKRFVNWLKKTRLIKAIRKLFQRIFTPRKFKAKMEGKRKAHSEGVVEATSQRMENFKETQIGTVGKKDAQYQVRAADLIAPAKIKHSNSRSISEAAYDKDRPVPHWKSGNVELTPVRVINGKIEKDKIVPTAIRDLGGIDDTDLNHVTNIYTCKVPGNPPVIRSGVIETPEKAQELVQVVKSVAISDKGKEELNEAPKTIRLVSHQLNSPEGEGNLIDNQHRELLTLKEESLQVAHINTPSNRFFDYTQAFRKVPIVGKVIEKVALKGEKLSKEQNIEGWGQYFIWLNEDLNLSTEMSTRIKGRLGEITESLEKNDKKALKTLREEMSEDLLIVYDMLEMHEDIKAKLFRSIIGQQLDLPSYQQFSRGAEIMLIQLLNDKMGIVSAINCKSGIDRTSFVHAVKLAMQQSELSDSELLDLVMGWDESTKEMNQMLTKKDGLQVFNEQLEWNEGWCINSEFRQLVLHNLLNHGLPITAYSTGLMGLKWHAGPTENRHPLNFIPPYIEVAGEKPEDEPKLVQIVKYDSKGKTIGLTDEGRHLLTQHSEYRGG